MMTDDAIVLADTLLERLTALANELWTRAGCPDLDVTDQGDETIPSEARIRMRQVAEAIDLRIKAWVVEAESLQAQAREFVV